MEHVLWFLQCFLRKLQKLVTRVANEIIYLKNKSIFQRTRQKKFKDKCTRVI